MKAQKAAAKAQQTMDAQEAARYLPEFDEESLIEPKIIEIFRAEGSVVRKEQVLAEDEVDEFEQGWQKGLALLKQEKGL